MEETERRRERGEQRVGERSRERNSTGSAEEERGRGEDGDKRRKQTREGKERVQESIETLHSRNESGRAREKLRKSL